MAEVLSSDDLEIRRRHMVEGQLRTCDVTDQTLLAAFASIPRDTFVAPAFASFAYMDRDVPALGGSGRMLLAPMILARLIQAANVRPGDKALDVAGGSGYSAAVLANLGAEVVALEADPGALAAAKDLLAAAKSVVLMAGDLAEGVEGRPFDVILVNGAFERSPEKLLALLAPAGRLVGIDASSGVSKAVIVEKIGGATSRRVLFDAAGPRLEAFSRTPSFAF